MTTASEIWQTLSKIDVNGKTEKKGNLTYLSWAWAWGVLMDKFPQADYAFLEDIDMVDGSKIVQVCVSIDSHSRTMWLPVLNFKNQAIQNPSAMDINTARMRCLTKCLAMFGLGHYIYAGEDLPEAVKEENGLKKQLFAMFQKAIKDDDKWLMVEVADRMNEEWWKATYNSFKDNKTEQKRNVDRLLSDGRKAWKQANDDLKQNVADGHEDGMIANIVEDIPSDYFKAKLTECVK